MAIEPRVAVSAFVPPAIHESLREIAKKQNRSLTQQVVWVLSRFVEAQEEDGA